MYAPSAVAATDDRDDFACLFVVVGGDELDERLVWRSAAEEGDDVLAVSPPLLLACGLAEPDVHDAFGACRAHEHAVARVAFAGLRPLVRLALPLANEGPVIREIGLPHSSRRGRLARSSPCTNRLDERILEARVREVREKRPELAIRNVLQSD